jgi:serine O-acetyltransferase
MENAMNAVAVADAGTTRAPGLWTLLREDVDCVFQRDPAARSRFEVITTYPGVGAILMQRLAHRLWHLGLRYPARRRRSRLNRFSRLET